MSRRLAVLASVLAYAAAIAQEVPIASPGDPRVRYITYRTDRSAVIHVRRGVVTRVVLARDEKIRMHGTGFPSRCAVDTDEWCIRAETGESQVWIKPRTGATHNNLELATDQRDYSIKLEVLPDAPKGEAPADEVFRAIFVYPASERSTETAADISSRSTGIVASAATADPGAVKLRPSGNLADLGCRRPWQILNAKYSREQGDGELAPLRVFDDGARTVFVFGDAAPLPVAFALGEDAAESRVNFSVDGNCLVVHQLGKQFVLRAGSASLKVWNEAYSPEKPSMTLRALRDSKEDLP